jgi:hypothetical protein
MSRRSRPTLFAAALLFAAAGCASTLHVAAPELAARASANPLAAQRDLGKKRVIVQGMVRQTSLTQRRSVVATGFGYGAVAEEKHDSIPVVILEPGSVLCYFEPEQIAAAAAIREGETVRLDCTIDSFRVEGGQVLSVLAGCDRE